MAPTKIQQPKGRRVKNDKKDAEQLATILRNHLVIGEKLDPVHVPDEHTLGIRELIRLRDFTVKEVTKHRNAISSMLLRNGMIYNKTKNLWTKTFRSWLNTVHFKNHLTQLAFIRYCDALNHVEKMVQEIEKEIQRSCQEWNERIFVIQCLQAFRGIGFLNSAKLVSEIESFSRFDHPRQLMKYTGLTCSEYSSGDTVTRGPITKNGNKRVRTLLIEAACNAMKPMKTKAHFRASCPKEVPDEVIQKAHKAHVRLHKKYYKMVRAGKHHNLAKVAIARELLGFLWNVASEAEKGHFKPRFDQTKDKQTA